MRRRGGEERGLDLILDHIEGGGILFLSIIKYLII